MKQTPCFGRKNVATWCSETEEFFKLYSSPDYLKVSMAMSCMEGSTLSWSRFIRQCDPEITWETFRTLLHKRYGPCGSLDAKFLRSGMFADSLRKLAVPTQTSDVSEYVDKFVTQALETHPMSRELYALLFLGGLKKEVRMCMKPKEPKDIMDAIVAALAAETELSGFAEEGEEMGSEPLSKCMDMNVLENAPKAKEPPYDPTLKKPPVGLKSTFIKFKGVMTGGELLVVVNGGTSHNLISNDVVRKLNLNLQPTLQFEVLLDDGRAVGSRSVCRNLEVKICNFLVVADFVNFNLAEGVDAVLGRTWLDTIEKARQFSTEEGREVLSFLHKTRLVVFHAEG